ncbi:MAG: ABC transporter ATP-binding protein [Clostridia bacterium]|nr:ABC transporter ATP-binding protein [Clostridia bacterium]
MSDLVIETKNLTKSYGAVHALKDFSISLERNRIYGLLGRNGAGKTTFLNLLTSRIFADIGEITVLGQNVVENQDVLAKMCYMPEKNLFIPSMKVSEIISSAAKFYETFDMEYALTLCTKFDLSTKKKFKALSRGYESIIKVVIGLASRAPITIFDEPVLGLDAAVRDLFYRELIEDYANAPRTFIISTHLIEESADIFEEILIIKEGTLIEHLPVEDLKERACYVSGKTEIVDSAISGLNVLHSEMIGNVKVSVVFEKLTEDIMKKLTEHDVEISPVPVQKIFIYLTGQKVDESDSIGGKKA